MLNSRRAIVSCPAIFVCGEISKGRIQKSLSTLLMGFAPFGSVSLRTHWPGLSPLIFGVELFAILPFFSRMPEVCQPPIGPCHHGQAPAASSVKETFCAEPFTRSAMFGYGLSPTDGI